MAADPVAAARIKRTGLGIIPPPLGISALAAMLRVVACGSTMLPARLVAAVPVDWQRLLAGAKDTASLSFFSDFVPPAIEQPVNVSGTKRQKALTTVRPSIAASPALYYSNAQIRTSFRIIMLQASGVRINVAS